MKGRALSAQTNKYWHGSVAATTQISRARYHHHSWSWSQLRRQYFHLWVLSSCHSQVTQYSFRLKTSLLRLLKVDTRSERPLVRLQDWTISAIYMLTMRASAIWWEVSPTAWTTVWSYQDHRIYMMWRMLRRRQTRPRSLSIFHPFRMAKSWFCYVVYVRYCYRALTVPLSPHALSWDVSNKKFRALQMKVKVRTLCFRPTKTMGSISWFRKQIWGERCMLWNDIAYAMQHESWTKGYDEKGYTKYSSHRALLSPLSLQHNLCFFEWSTLGQIYEEWFIG